LLARAIVQSGFEAPVTSGLARLISAELPLDEWVSLVRTTVPPPARRRVGVRVQAGAWKRFWARVRAIFSGAQTPAS
jgi:glycerol-3-phosphate dehydrogenase (NAD(P)+)